MAIKKLKNYKTDAFMTHSPFHFQEGYQIQIENRNKNCSHTEIDTLALKGLLNSVDFEILKLLGTYCYVNTHNLNYALNHTLPENYRKQDYKRNLKKLSDAGILLKHSICMQTDGEGSARQIVSPLRFYSLSPGARSYISSLMEVPYISNQTLPAYRIIELMAAAQLLIRFQASYRNSVKRSFLICINRLALICSFWMHTSVIPPARGTAPLLLSICFFYAEGITGTIMLI